MDALFVPLASAVGASLDQVKLITCLLVAYPIGSIFIRIPSSQPNLKHLFNISVTLFFLLPVLNLYTGCLQLLADILLTYYVAANVRSKNMPWIVFVLIMGHLMANHIIRAWFSLSYETVEVTGPQMVLTMKLTTFAWNVWDGRRPAGDLDKWQLAKRVTKYPSLVEFLGYCFYFPGVLVGPYLEYADYMALVDESLFKSAEGKTKPGFAVPTGRKRVAYRKMVMGLAYLGVFVVFGGTYNFNVALTPDFMKMGYLKRVIMFQMYGVFERSKYYAIWTLTEGASILTGLGFSGFSPDGTSKWEGAANVKPSEIEFPSNFKMLLDSWNMKTNVWLRECVYKRVTPKGQKPGFASSMITFAASAFWHGIAGGYYLAFFFGGFITTTARQARGTLRPLFLGENSSSSKLLYDLAGSLLSVLVLNYAAAPFMILNIKESLICWHRLGWYGVIIIGFGMVFFSSPGAKALKKMHPKPAAQASATPVASGAGTPVGSFAVPPLDKAIQELDGVMQKQK